MAFADQQPVIIKKIKKSAHAHHGGAWKIAYADFVTAMMAFFLMLWLISMTTPLQKKGIADYFAPPNVSQTNSGAGGVDINPNPVSTPINIFLHDFDAANADLAVLNAAGQLMYRSRIALLNGSELLRIDNSAWAKGVYTVIVKAGNKKIVKRIIR